MTTDQPTTDRDPRLTLDLLADVIHLLERHGFTLPTEEAPPTGRTLTPSSPCSA